MRSLCRLSLFVASALFAGPAMAHGPEDPSPGPAAPPSVTPTWDQFAAERSGFCVGGPGRIEPPVEIKAGHHRYRLEGDRLVQLDRDPDKVLRIGVISATKDERDETIASIETFIAKLKKLRMDVLIVNGDIATHEINMDERVLPALAKSGVLTVVIIGNTESCGQFNQATNKVAEKYPNLVNGNWVRELHLEDGTLFTLPGYYDRKFTHTGGAATYGEGDLLDLMRRIRKAPGPKVLVSHGPPKMSGKFGIDEATEAGNVGDEAMTQLIKDAKIPFGIFGHILEAGGRASDLSGKKHRKAMRWHSSLFVNAGTANPDPWSMLDGSTAWGMAIMVEVKEKKALFHVLELPRPR